MTSTQLKIYFILLALPIIVINSKGIQKRFLIFPQQTPTRYQFICGIGIPADLDQESLTVGYVLKSEYFLPYNATSFRQNPFVPEFRRTQRNIKSVKPSTSMSRFHAYKAFENVISRPGLNGTECLLHAICESARMPFFQLFDIYADLIHIFLTPSSTPYEQNNKLKAYNRAERIGKKGGESCHQAYKDCNVSILEVLSTFV